MATNCDERFMPNSEALSFLSGKFTPHLSPDVYAPRLKLLEKFHRAATENRSIYLGAPAGSGKTVSALLWLKACARKVVWIGLDTYDNIPSVFYKQLATGLFSLQPDNSAMQAVLVNPSFSDAPVSHTVQLISEMRPGLAPCTLVLDDMHLITNGEIVKSLPFILNRMPLCFVVLVLSRHNLPPEFSELVAENKLALIPPEDLRFTEDEIRGYFQDLGRAFIAEDARKAYLATDGWAMGVNTIAKAGQIDIDGKYSFKHFFATQLWDKWEPELRDFCLKTSIVDEFDPELARALTGRPDAEEVMQHLSRTNSFLRLLHGNTYRCHHLFLAFLREQLSGQKVDVGALYRAAAEYYKKHKDYSRALHFWLNCEDYQQTDDYLALFLTQNKLCPVASYADFLRPFFLKGFPQKVYRAFPPLHLLAVWYYYITGCHTEFARHMDAIMQKLPQIAAINPTYAECGLLAYSVDHRSNILEKNKGFALFNRHIKRYTPQGLATFVPSFTHNLPYLHRSSFDHACIALDPKGLNKLDGTFARLLGPEWSYVRPGIQAGLSYERGQLAKALELNTLALGAQTADSRVEGRICLLMLQHSTLWQLQKRARATAVMERLEALAGSSARFFSPNLAAYRVKLRLFDRDRGAAREWLEQYFVVKPQKVEPHRLFQHFTTARAHMALNEHDTAADYLRLLRGYGENLNRPLDTAEACLLFSVLHWACGRQQEALQALEDAVLILQPYGFTRVIADEGASILPALKRLAAKTAREDYAGTLSREFLNEAILAAHAMAKLHQGLAAEPRADKPIKLSKQQARMLSLLSQGYKNAEIAEITALSIPTVKSHTSIAYRKLGVNNAMDAVLKARELRLIG